MTEPSAVDPATNGETLAPAQDPGYWFSLVDQNDGADFLHLTPRFMEAARQRGDGPPYIRISARCIRYRRIDLKSWAEKLLRKSTSDPGQATAENAARVETASEKHAGDVVVRPGSKSPKPMHARSPPAENDSG